MEHNFIRLSALVMVLALCVCLACPAFATWDDSDITVIDYLDYADADHLYVVDGAKYVEITIPCDNAVSSFVIDDGIVVTNAWGNQSNVHLDFNYKNGFTLYVSPLNDFYPYDVTPRVSAGYLLDCSKFISGSAVFFNWTMYIRGGTFSSSVQTEFKQYCNYFGVADVNGYSYQTGRTGLYTIQPTPNVYNTYTRFQTVYYVDDWDTVGTVSNYIAPVLSVDFLSAPVNTSLSFGLNDMVIRVPINDELLNLAESQQNQKLLTAINDQLADQGKTMDEVLKQQQQANDKLEDVIGGTPEQNEIANNSSGQLTDKGEQLGGLVDDIQTEKPNLDSVDVDKIIPSAGINTLSAAISPIAENPLVIKILVMVGTLLLVSYVLFGKKG